MSGFEISIVDFSAKQLVGIKVRTWLAAQAEWKLNEQAPCFELYPADWNPTVPFEVYMPVKR